MTAEDKYTVYAEHALGQTGLIATPDNLLVTIDVCLLVSPTKRVLVVAGIGAERPPRGWEVAAEERLHAILALE